MGDVGDMDGNNFTSRLGGVTIRARVAGVLFGCLASCLAMLLSPRPAEAITIPCAGDAGDEGALVTAIETANANGMSLDTIELTPDCVYSFTNPYNSAVIDYDFWYGPSALPAIASSVTIVGHGATIERTSLEPFRLLFVGAGRRGHIRLRESGSGCSHAA